MGVTRSKMDGVGWALVALVIFSACTARDGSSPAETVEEQRHLLIVLDGLRPDYVTPALMPNLHALGMRGVIYTNHHAVYPTVTRVNASSISTGAYPETHGLLGNSVFFPSVDPTGFLDTGDRTNLLAVQQAEQGVLLTAPTLSDQLAADGRALLVVSAGSTGSSYLLNHTVAGGGIIHYDYGLPASLGEAVVGALDAVPPASTPNDERNRYVIDAFFDIGLPQIDPAVTLMWLSDPDASAHAHGIGHPTSDESLRRLDADLGYIEARLDEIGWLETLNIWVTSDHGFSTHTGAVDLAGLIEPYDQALADGTPRIVTGSGAIYVRDRDRETVARIVSDLQSSPRVGAIFTAAAEPGSRDGWVPGTLSFDVARWQHDRSAEILFSPNWTDAENEYGYRGTSAQGGVAGHGSSSPFDIHNTLVAAGPQLKSALTIDVPSGNVDFAPTFLSMLGIDIPPSMQGRVLREALVDGPAPSSIEIDVSVHTVQREDGSYRLTASSSTIDGYRYLDFTEVVRTP